VKQSAHAETVFDFLCEALENELGGIEVYEAALRCARDDGLREEWERYLEETREHVDIYRNLCQELGVDPDQRSPGRDLVHALGEALVDTIRNAEQLDPAAAEVVAAECVVIAETKCHLNWELVGELAKSGKGNGLRALKEAHAKVEVQEDEHLYHTMGWARELWIQRLGMPAAIPPPEEEKHVRTAIGAARAKSARKEMVKGKRKRNGS
jgi:hypothetical protein